MESDLDWSARIIRRIYDMVLLGKPCNEWPAELQEACMWAYTHHDE